MEETIRILPCGDSALTLVLGDRVSEAVHRRVKAMELTLRRAALPGVLELVPTYTTVCVHYDPCRVLFCQLEAAIRGLAFAPEAAAEAGRLIEIPVCYGGEYGPDLKAVAAHAGLLPEEVVRRHTAPEYLVYMLGFLPGFAYLGGLDETIACPRLQTPRTRIPAGSVGIAGSQTGIYPLASPGGWQLIGRTPETLFSLTEQGESRFLLSPGDRVRFVAVPPEAFREGASAV